MEVHGHFFGACSLSLSSTTATALRLDRSVAECAKAFAGHDGALYEESYNLLNAWLAVVPGNAAHNLRRLTLLNTNAPISASSSRSTPAHAPARIWATASASRSSRPNSSTPYFWNLHYEDVGHTLCSAPPGAASRSS